MITSILGLLAVLIPFVIWLWKRKAAKNDDPTIQAQRRRELLAKEIIDRDRIAINGSLRDDLDRLRPLPGDSQRPGSNSTDRK